jgi:hypothetical protein
MTSKYASIFPQLPRLTTAEDEEDPKFQEKVDKVKATISVRSAIKLASSWDVYRKRQDELNAELKSVKLTLEAHRQLMEEAYESEGVKLIVLADGSPIRAQPEPYSKVEDWDKFNEWCTAEGLDSQRKLAWMTLNALAKTRLLAGLALPPGVKTYFRTKFVRK